MHRLEVIQRIIDTIGARVYVEIGVRYGTVFLRVKAPQKIGIDPRLQIPFHKKLLFAWDFLRNKYFSKTSDDFFAENAGLFKEDKIDVVFIDGLHTYEQSLRDVENSLKYLNPGGVIIMHDCNPTTEAMASSSFELFKKTPNGGKAWCGDVWKTIVYVRSVHKGLEAFVLDADFGLGIIVKGRNENPLPYAPAEIEKMSYSDLSQDRKNLLNLKSQEYFGEFISRLNEQH